MTDAGDHGEVAGRFNDQGSRGRSPPFCSGYSGREKTNGRSQERWEEKRNDGKENNIRENYEKRRRSWGPGSPRGPLLAQVSTMKW